MDSYVKWNEPDSATQILHVRSSLQNLDDDDNDDEVNLCARWSILVLLYTTFFSWDKVFLYSPDYPKLSM